MRENDKKTITNSLCLCKKNSPLPPPLISFILRAWAKLNPNFNVLNYLVMYMRYLKPWRYPKPKFLMCKRHRTRFFVHRYFCQIFGIFVCLLFFIVKIYNKALSDLPFYPSIFWLILV